MEAKSLLPQSDFSMYAEEELINGGLKAITDGIFHLPSTEDVE